MGLTTLTTRYYPITGVSKITHNGRHQLPPRHGLQQQQTWRQHCNALALPANQREGRLLAGRDAI